ncbi:DUF2092 domain-containing protein [Longimicrobium sp.]|uniref:DUF2092 domain-containing protein n=1 Tax=Longimicrobium sp. TaxID=2029185 RepID=UPI002E2FE96F|nr:DUF2092 domain-containing protein [Longimicrobium sp.]HEX6039635.1 DUF2092 domain-containing protein [Longimicrobium sp.]
MRNRAFRALALAAVAAAWQPPAPARAQVDTAAMNALARMGTYLNSLTTFQVRAEITREEVLADGQKVQLASSADLVADQPRRLRVNVSDDRQQRLLLYDGRSFTLFAPRLNFYATTAAPGSIQDLARQLEDRHGVELPLVDLFRWGTPEARVAEITSAMVVGPAEVGGVTCEQYAFRQAGLDWQVWIQKGEFPLPCRLVLTTLTDEARPQHATTYTWNLAPSFNDAAFAFVPPADARQITFAEVAAERASRN